MNAIETSAHILEICIKETAIKCSQLAAENGVYANETEILLAVESDPEGPMAKAFKGLFASSLIGAQMASR